MTHSPVTRRSGLTLVEILIAMVMTLIVLLAMMEAFKYASGEMQRSRATIELSNQLRAAQELLRSDLDHLTLDPRPWTQTALPKGYFEYVESQNRDANNAASQTDNYLGDLDDILAFTVNRPKQPFRGRLNLANEAQPKIVESPMAEVIWWTEWDDRAGGTAGLDFDESLALCRKTLLIRPDLNNANGHLGIIYDETETDEIREFLMENDLSVRVILAADGNRYWAANRLEDLGSRLARVGRSNPDNGNMTFLNFPHLLDRNWLSETRMGNFETEPTLSGDDIVLTNIASFDVKAYSPTAEVEVDAATNLVIQPGDVGYSNANSNNRGAFVDLNYSPAGTGWFAGPGHPKSGLNANINAAYDTWTPVYEVGGPGTDGIDNDNNNGVDDTGERLTMPPYSHPIRGLKVSFRLVEKNTKQLRQASIIHSFVPE